MKYLDLIWKLFVWNLIGFVGTIIFLSFFSGYPPAILMLAIVIGLPLGTTIGISKYKKSQNKISVNSVSSVVNIKSGN
jgi:hypothetical protein